MLRIGIAGLGSISGIHLAAIGRYEGAKVTAVCDIDQGKRDKAPETVLYGTVAHCCNSSIELQIVMEREIMRIKDNKLVLTDGFGECLLAEDQVIEGESIITAMAIPMP